MRERPFSDVPKPAVVLLICALVVQVFWHFSHSPRQVDAENLPPPPTLFSMELTSLGEPIGCAKTLMLYLQAFDSQPGASTSFIKLDYRRVQQWLNLILQLDPPGQYPLFAASRVYGDAPDPAKQRIMFDFTYKQFFLDPNRRWPWLAHAAVMSKHHLHDLPRARLYAKAIREHATGKDVPGWAKQMDIFILEDMNEYDSAAILLTAMLRSGQISDQHELDFLQARLAKIQDKAKSIIK
jgi:hypothetical protein